MRFYRLIIIIAAGLLSSCFGHATYAPVTDISAIESIPQNGVYRVSVGETIYSIAWRYGVDYRDLARQNRIKPPYQIRVGQSIYLKEQAPQQAPSAPKQYIAEKEPTVSVATWQWPAHGPVVSNFSSMNKGINIAGKLGAPVFATAAGKVVYSGDGLRAYGNLIIIKHNSTFLSAYAYNKVVLVKEGTWVKAGQKIAEMGNLSARRVMLHFEIRRRGKPVNPLNYLKKQV